MSALRRTQALSSAKSGDDVDTIKKERVMDTVLFLVDNNGILSTIVFRVLCGNSGGRFPQDRS